MGRTRGGVGYPGEQRGRHLCIAAESRAEFSAGVYVSRLRCGGAVHAAIREASGGWAEVGGPGDQCAVCRAEEFYDTEHEGADPHETGAAGRGGEADG